MYTYVYPFSPSHTWNIPQSYLKYHLKEPVFNPPFITLSFPTWHCFYILCSLSLSPADTQAGFMYMLYLMSFVSKGIKRGVGCCSFLFLRGLAVFSLKGICRGAKPNPHQTTPPPPSPTRALKKEILKMGSLQSERFSPSSIPMSYVKAMAEMTIFISHTIMPKHPLFPLITTLDILFTFYFSRFILYICIDLNILRWLYIG